MDDERARRIGANEAAFRQVNEEIEDLNRGIALLADGKLHIVCECGDITCVQQLPVDVLTYERVRSDPELFFVAHGHEIASVESIVEQADDYDVVRKDHDAAEQVARETDPRS